MAYGSFCGRERRWLRRDAGHFIIIIIIVIIIIIINNIIIIIIIITITIIIIIIVIILILLISRIITIITFIIISLSNCPLARVIGPRRLRRRERYSLPRGGLSVPSPRQPRPRPDTSL